MTDSGATIVIAGGQPQPQPQEPAIVAATAVNNEQGLGKYRILSG